MPDRDIRAARGEKGRWRLRPYRQIGYRGKALLLLGIAWVMLGVEALRLDPADYLYHELILPTGVRGAVWTGSGLVAILLAFRPKGMSDVLAWPILYSLPAIRAFMYFISWVDYLMPIGSKGYEHGWVYTIMFGMMAIVVVFLSGWPEPYFGFFDAETRRAIREKAGQRRA